MNLQDMIDEMRDHGFTDTLDDRLIGFINDAYYDVCSRLPWPFLEKSASFVTNGADFQTIPADFGAADAVVIDGITTGPLRFIRYDELTKRYAGSLTTTGTPYYYYFLSNQMGLYPIPDDATTVILRYVALPTELQNIPGLDIPLIPDRHRRVLVLGALVSAYNMEDDTDLGVVFASQFEARIARMQTDLAMRQYDRTEVVQTMYDYDDVFGWDY